MKQKLRLILAVLNVFPYEPLSEAEQKKVEAKSRREFYGMSFRYSLISLFIFIIWGGIGYVVWGLGLFETWMEVITWPIIAAIGIVVSILILLYSKYKSIILFLQNE